MKSDSFSLPYRHCDIYISTKYKHIMFVPFRRVGGGLSAEHENIISDIWPCDFGRLEENIEEALNRNMVAYVNYDGFKSGRGNYPLYNNSKGKSESSFHSEYVKLQVETDNTKEYSIGESERITVMAKPTALETTYRLKGTYHMIDTEVAQLVLDIFGACMKIRD
jgi:hypothetical protein